MRLRIRFNTKKEILEILLESCGREYLIEAIKEKERIESLKCYLERILEEIEDNEDEEEIEEQKEENLADYDFLYLKKRHEQWQDGKIDDKNMISELFEYLKDIRE